ncbi:MAG: aminodeoxychorismate/anthranilate synthase component II [Spirochaetota bacterium]
MSTARVQPLRRVLLLDNFDSFTWNVADGLAAAGALVEVRRVDGIDLAGVVAAAPELIVLSPGPGRPEDASLSLAAIGALAGIIPILGICLGHQCVAVAFGGRVARSPEPVHGKTAWISHDGRGLFTGLPEALEVGRYHSLVVAELPPDLEACAWTAEGLVMGLRHRRFPIAGLQFHPDSFLSASGPAMFRNALDARF